VISSEELYINKVSIRWVKEKFLCGTISGGKFHIPLHSSHVQVSTFSWMTWYYDPLGGIEPSSCKIWVCSHLLTLVPRSWIFLHWRWRWYVPPKCRFTQKTTWCHIPENGILHSIVGLAFKDTAKNVTLILNFTCLTTIILRLWFKTFLWLPHYFFISQIM
jgi:hypothetical protein